MPRLARLLVVVVVMTASCLAVAGRADLWRMWAYLALCFAGGIAAMLMIDAEVIRQRLSKGHRTADPVVLILLRLLFLATLVVSLLDTGRFHWSDEVPAALSVAALVLVAAGLAIAFVAISVNRFFMPQIRIQAERGHRVIDVGPYARVRHPGYAGMLLVAPASGLALGSWAGFGAGLLNAVVFIVRAAVEDRFLHGNLAGYPEYAARVRHRLVPGLWVLALLAVAAPLAAQDTTRTPDRPFVEGGVYDRPYLTRLLGRTAIGGYAEAHTRYERVDGVTEEAGFRIQRWNLFTATQVSDFVRIGAELEFENGTEEIRLEYAAIDLTVHPALAFRAGMLLSPLGKFNLSHDSPRNEFTDRPLVSTEILGVALSEPGLGMLGRFGLGGSRRLTYELYATNGFTDGLLTGSSDGTRIPLGRDNVEDNNASPAFVGRLAVSPAVGYEIGVSGHYGAYNVYLMDGAQVDDRRNLTIAVVDGEAMLLGVELEGEAALARVDIPANLAGLFASRQSGLYLQALRPFGTGWVKVMPNSTFAAGIRLDVVDFDTDLAGDNVRQVSLGFNFRPTSDTVLKLNYVRGVTRDRFNNPSDFARALFSIATYF